MTDSTAPKTRPQKSTTIIKFFGKQPGQSLSEAVAEVKLLTDADVDQLFSGIDDGTLSYQ